MFWSSDKNRQKIERNILYDSCITVNGTAIGDGFYFNFGVPVYIRYLIANFECYYYHDSSGPSVVSLNLASNQIQNGWPVVSVVPFGTTPTGAWSIGGPGTTKRLQAPNFSRHFYPEALRVMTLGIFRLSSNVNVNIGWFI